MIWKETPLQGVFVLEIERREDERGFFARTFDAAEFREKGLGTVFPEASVSFNHRAGTVRGMHFQSSPHEEEKLVRCTAGRVFDVALDLRPGSPTLHQWFGVELSAENHRTLFVPRGCAHGFQTLEERSELTYLISAPHVASAARGVHPMDASIGIRWPLEVTVISERDRNLPGV